MNSVARGENSDGVDGASCIARSMNADDCARAKPGTFLGLCSLMVASASRPLSLKGSGREAARLTVELILGGGGGIVLVALVGCDGSVD